MPDDPQSLSRHDETGWSPPDRLLTFHGAIFGAPYPALVFAGIGAALVVLLVAPGTLGDRIATGGWCIIGVHLASCALSIRTRLIFRGWSLTTRTAVGRTHTLDVRTVRRIHRRPRPFERSDGRDFLTRLARRPHDFDLYVSARSRPIRVPLHQFPYDGGPAVELMQRLAMVPQVDADPDTAATLADWRHARGLPER